MAIVAEMDPVTQEVTHHAGSKRHTAVVRAAEALQARPFMPPLGDRLSKGMDLALTGKVTALGHGAYTVQSGAKTYTLDPLCTCQDSQHRSKWCKHAIAVELTKLAHQAQAGNGNGNGKPAAESFSAIEHAPITPPAQPGPPQPQPVQQLPEAPASICMRWEDHGISMQLTLRDVDDAALFARVKAVLPKIKTTVAAQHQADIEAAEAGTIPAEAWCERHKVRMKHFTKGTRSWYSHKLADNSWCNGRQ